MENLVGFAKADLMVPQAPFGDLTAANAAARAWCAEVNGVVHSEICAVPAERMLTERELLGPLPSLRASIGKMTTRKVDRLSCVRFASARYSVPMRLIGAEVRLRTDDGRLLVIMSGTGQVVAEHTLVAPGEASVRDEHYGGPRPDTPRRAVRPKTAAEKEFCALGAVAEAFITGAAAAGSTRLGADLAELNTLRAAHGDQEFLAALDRAVAFCRWRPADVRSILAAGAGVPGPRVPAGDALILDLPAVPVRPLADYAIGGAVMTAARAAAGPRHRRRAAAAQTRHDPAARPRAAGHREDPAVGARGTAADPDRRRDHRPRRLQRPDPHEGSSVPGDQDPRRAGPVRMLHPRPDPGLPRLAGMDHRQGELVPGRAGRHGQKPRPGRARHRRRRTPGTRSGTSPPRTWSTLSTAAWPTTPPEK